LGGGAEVSATGAGAAMARDGAGATRANMPWPCGRAVKRGGCAGAGSAGRCMLGTAQRLAVFRARSTSNVWPEKSEGTAHASERGITSADSPTTERPTI
jgi:hypothetical protein